MKILVFGGTRFFGIHLVENLLEAGHEVTIATRGLSSDRFGDRVERLRVDRNNADDLDGIFRKEHYDCIFDNICYSSMDIKRLLEVAKCERYVYTSTMSVYPLESFALNLKEEDFEPSDYGLRWLEREAASYDEIKRQAECALFKQYGNWNAAAVRFPFVIGENDYTKRLLFYVEHVIGQSPMYIDNLTAQMSFIQAQEAAKFLAWLIPSKQQGIFNAANRETVTIQWILDYIQKKTGKSAVLSEKGETAPYNGIPAYSINTERAEKAGYHFGKLHDILEPLLDYYIRMCLKA